MILPEDFDFPEEAEETAAELPLLMDLALDLETGQLAVRNGRHYTVTGLEALRIWIWKALRTNRGQYTAYSDQFGQDLEEVFGQTDLEMAQVLAQDYLTEALETSPYILDVRDFQFERSGSGLEVAFVVDSIYGQVEETLEVEL